MNSVLVTVVLPTGAFTVSTEKFFVESGISKHGVSALSALAADGACSYRMNSYASFQAFKLDLEVRAPLVNSQFVSVILMKVQDCSC